MQAAAKDITAADIQVVGVSYDSPAILKRLVDKKGVAFPLLSDPKSQLIRKFGILNQQANGKLAGVPHPKTFVVDQNKKIVAVLNGTVRKRHSVADLIKSVQK